MTPLAFYALAVASMLCAITPAVLFVLNLRTYRTPALPLDLSALPAVSVLIPARDEAHGIEAAIASVLASRHLTFEVIVMDDNSTDNTAALVAAMAARDPRVRLEQAPSLPLGWNGKQHACWALAHAARHDLFCFVDADVRLEPEALVRMAAFLEESRSALVSGFPRQVTETWMEWLLLPLIHFVLLGYLPIDQMRKGSDPAFAAGCGQFLMVERGAYFAAGGHAEIKSTMHDGLLLPRLLRQHGLRTDLADLTALARCRMYSNAGQVWRGLAKNATEGIARTGTHSSHLCRPCPGPDHAVSSAALVTGRKSREDRGARLRIDCDSGSLAAQISGRDALSPGLAQCGSASFWNRDAARNPVVLIRPQTDRRRCQLEGSRLRRRITADSQGRRTPYS